MQKDDEDNIKDFYNNVYYKNIESNHKFSKHETKLVKKLGICDKQSVLDVACGTGEFLRACKHSGASVSGVDLSEVAVTVCKESMPSGEFHACSAETLPFGDDQFDVVTCLGSLEHFINPLAALNEMVRVGKEGAVFVILVPNEDFLTRKLGLYKGTYQVDAKEVVRSLGEWNALFETSGLLVIERWKDLHVLSWKWISLSGWRHVIPRFIQAIALIVWPLKWQYQVFHLARVK